MTKPQTTASFALTELDLKAVDAILEQLQFQLESFIAYAEEQRREARHGQAASLEESAGYVNQLVESIPLIERMRSFGKLADDYRQALETELLETTRDAYETMKAAGQHHEIEKLHGDWIKQVLKLTSRPPQLSVVPRTH